MFSTSYKNPEAIRLDLRDVSASAKDVEGIYQVMMSYQRSAMLKDDGFKRDRFIEQRNELRDNIATELDDMIAKLTEAREALDVLWY